MKNRKDAREIADDIGQKHSREKEEGAQQRPKVEKRNSFDRNDVYGTEQAAYRKDAPEQQSTKEPKLGSSPTKSRDRDIQKQQSKEEEDQISIPTPNSPMAQLASVDEEKMSSDYQLDKRIGSKSSLAARFSPSRNKLKSKGSDHGATKDKRKSTKQSGSKTSVVSFSREPKELLFGKEDEKGRDQDNKSDSVKDWPPIKPWNKIRERVSFFEIMAYSPTTCWH